MLEHLRIRQLQLIVEIYEQSSIAGAAQSLNMSQPAATKALQQLEVYFDTPLVKRGRHGSTLTPTGEALYRHSKNVLATVRSAANDIQEITSGKAGTVRIGALPVALPVLLPETLNRLHDRYPGVVAQVTTGDSSLLIEMLRQERIDLVVGRTWAEEDRDLESTVLYSSSFSLVARNGHPIFESQKPSLLDATRYDWVVPPSESYAGRALMSGLREAGFATPAHSIETISYILTRELVRKSDMLAPVDRSTLKNDLKDGLVRETKVDLGILLPSIGVSSLRKDPKSAAELRFIECLTETARDVGAGY